MRIAANPHATDIYQPIRLKKNLSTYAQSAYQDQLGLELDIQILGSIPEA